MNQFVKLGGILVAATLSIQAHSQNFVSDVPLQRLLTGVLQPASTNLPVANNANPVPTDHIYAFPWSPIADNIPANATNPVKITAVSLPAGASNLVWNVQGDLAIMGGQGTTTVMVGNTNLTPRNGPGGGLLPNDRGQSKGRLTLTYTYPAGTSGACAGILISAIHTIDLLKKFSYTTTPTAAGNNTVSQIIGPTCLQPNTDYTFSVDETMVDNPNAGIGIDRYTWRLSGFTGAFAPAAGGNPLYTSSDLSSFTFRTGAQVPPSGAIRCYFGEANVDPATSNSSLHAFAELKLIQATGVPVVTLSGAATGTINPSTAISAPSICIPTTTAGTGTLTFTVTQQAGATYSWKFGTYNGNNPTNANGWNTSPAATGALPFTSTGTSLTISNISNQPGTVVLTVTGSCGLPQEYTYHINRRHSVPASISFSPTCLLPNGTSQATLAANASQNNLAWGTTSGFSFGATGLVTALNPAPGVYTIQAGFVGCTPNQSYTLNVRPASISFTPTTLCIPRNGTPVPVTFTPSGTNQYSFSVTGSGNTLNGATATTVSGTSHIVNVQRTTSAAGGNLSATYTVAAGCATTLSPDAPISTPPVTPIPLPPSCINGGMPSATAAITISTHLGVGTYTVNYVSGAQVLVPSGSYTPNGSNQIIVPVSPTVIGIGSYTVTHTVPGCGTAQTSLPFTLDNATGRPTILLAPSGSNLVCLPSPILPYTYLNCGTGNPLPTNVSNPVNPVTNTTAQWVFTVASGGTSVGIQATLANGCVHRVCTTINYSGKPGRDLIERFERRPGLPATFGKIYPNPSDGEFEIELFSGSEKTDGRALIVDAKGQVLQTLVLSSGHNKIKEKFVPGVYSVITFVDGKEYFDRLVIH